MIGVAGLGASISYIRKRGVDRLLEEERSMLRHLLEGLREIPGLISYGPHDPAQRVPVVSVNFPDVHPSHLATILEQGYGILGRDGLHCAPSAHQTLGTFPDGTLRIAPGPFLGPDAMDMVLRAFREVSRQIAR